MQISAINKRLVLRLGGMTLAITSATGPIRCELPAIWFYETLALEGEPFTLDVETDNGHLGVTGRR